MAADLPLPLYRLAFALGLVAALALRLALGTYSLWFDDYASLVFAGQPYSRLWSAWMLRETNPPLFYALLRLWQQVPGLQAGAHAILALRLLPIQAGIAQIATVGWICARWHSRQAAVFAVWLMALSAQHIFASQMLRGYVFTMLGVTVSLAGLLLWWEGGAARRRGMALYVGGALLAFYCHTTLLLWQALAPLAILALRWREMAANRWQVLRDGLTMAVLAALGSAWWLAMSVAQLRAGATPVSWMLPIDFTHTLLLYSDYGMIARVLDFSDFRAWALTMLLLGLALWQGRGLRPVRLAALLAVLAPLAWWACGFIHPVLNDRTLLWPMGGIVVVLACGVMETRTPWLRAGIALTALAMAATNLAQRVESFPTQDWDGALATIANTPGAVLVVEHQAVATVAGRACALRFGPAGCPFPVLALASPVKWDSWAQGLSPYPLQTVPEIRARLAGASRVYTIRHNAYYDPLLHLAPRLIAPRTAWNKPFLEGPFPGSAFAR